MNEFIRRTILLSLLLGFALAGGIAIAAETRPVNGDGSGIGGTGNRPGGSGLGGTGTREQQLPDTMPELPETPDAAEVPDLHAPELPDGIDPNDMGIEPPDTEIPTAD